MGRPKRKSEKQTPTHPFAIVREIRQEGKSDMTHPSLRKPTAGECCRCRRRLEGDDIFQWSASSWQVWCFQCYKADHYPNLVRKIEEDN